jgi:hypothetical protein
MASPETPLQKTLRIKTAVVTRVKKELDQYKVDLDAQREKVETMRAEDRDEFDIRQQQEVFNETERVIPDTIRRLQRAVEELNEFVVSFDFSLLAAWGDYFFSHSASVDCKSCS